MNNAVVQHAKRVLAPSTLKKQAKEMVRASGCKHTAALEELAKREGHASWKHYLMAYEWYREQQYED